tara:strand:+ start:843 stop:1412 length:570 start_codon:yes stop_codon:yes gene_type:complete
MYQNNFNPSVAKYQELLNKFQEMLQNQINEDQVNFHKTYKSLDTSKKPIIKKSNNTILIVIIVILIIVIIGIILFYFLVIKKKQDDISKNNKITSDPQKLIYIKENMMPQGTKVRLKNMKFHEYYNKYSNSFDGATGTISWEKDDNIKLELSTAPNIAGHVLFDKVITTYDQKQWKALPNVLLKYIDEI